MTIIRVNCNRFVNLTFIKVMENLSKCQKERLKISKDRLGSVLPLTELRMPLMNFCVFIEPNKKKTSSLSNELVIR